MHATERYLAAPSPSSLSPFTGVNLFIGFISVQYTNGKALYLFSATIVTWWCRMVLSVEGRPAQHKQFPPGINKDINIHRFHTLILEIRDSSTLFWMNKPQHGPPQLSLWVH